MTTSGFAPAREAGATSDATYDEVWRTGDRQARLSAREHEALVLIASDLTNKEIARRMGISPATARAYVQNILRKTQSASRTGAAMFFAQRHPPSGPLPACALERN